MITRQELEGKWNEVKGRVRERWAEVTDDELQHARGNAEQLVGVIEQRTGESREAIEDFLEQAVTDGNASVKQAADAAREYAEKASQSVREQYEQVEESARAGYERAEQAVKRNPLESVAVAFGAGIITGVVVGVLLKSK